MNDLPPVDGLGARGTIREVEQFGWEALAYDTDISDHNQVAALFTASVARFGHIDNDRGAMGACAAHTRGHSVRRLPHVSGRGARSSISSDGTGGARR